MGTQAAFDSSPLWATALTGLGLLILARALAALVYNLWLHPLAKFPGPVICAASNSWFCYRFLGGRQPYHLLRLHEKYGSVVRVAPNELSFNSAQSWRDIYDFRQGHRTFVKGDFYDNNAFAEQSKSIVTESDPVVHGEMRKLFSHAFSLRSLSEQEPMIAAHIDDFVDMIGKAGSEPGGTNLGQWFDILAFDIISDLAFGRSFDGIKQAKPHPWMERMVDALTKMAVIDSLKRFPMVKNAVLTLLSGLIKMALKDVQKNEAIVLEWVRERRAAKSDRKDILSKMLGAEGAEELSDVKIAAHVSDICLAGADTTAVTLTVIEYYLARTPAVRRKLEAEVRGAYAKYTDITAASTAPLKYLHAVCLEALRLFPPVPVGLPRKVPPGGDIVDGNYIPAGVSVSTNPLAACLAPANFADPRTFAPERWLDNPLADTLDASQPFSMGPRGCIGRNLAWIELHTALAKIHFRYDVRLLDASLDWHAAARMNTLWKKPALRVAVAERT